MKKEKEKMRKITLKNGEKDLKCIFPSGIKILDLYLVLQLSLHSFKLLFFSNIGNRFKM